MKPVAVTRGDGPVMISMVARRDATAATRRFADLAPSLVH